ncbi:hypothetical protein KUTeg_017115 [Tegillarca granosa]|uniref:Uncharacterized protein n=1 Tax=Tegillarca granosa TaxID=220873 RepID=A0ABQ9ET46_TEGGR|nr:hypothetical protein KUTeg_017115 [Tegillarca granosa]
MKNRLADYGIKTGMMKQEIWLNSYQHLIPVNHRYTDRELQQDRQFTKPEMMFIQGDWCLTCTGERSLMVDNGDNSRVLIFSTVENLQHLANAYAIFCDGTFYTCPTIFNQLYTIHAMVNSVM